MLHINRYPVWPDGARKKQSASSFGPLSGTLIEKYDARYVLDPTELMDASNPWGIPTLLWIDGDGTTPTASPNPLLSLATTGVVVPGKPMPHTYPSGVDATGEEYSGASWRRDNVNLVDPALADDVVVAVKYRMQQPLLNSGSLYMACGTYGDSGAGAHPSKGWAIGKYTNHRLCFVFYAVGGNVFVLGPDTPFTPGSVNICIAVVNRDANMQAWLNGVAGAAAATPGGSVAGNGFGIGDGLAGPWPYTVGAGTRVEWLAAWYGADLWEAWTADSNRLIQLMSSESMGLRETVAVPRKLWVHSRTANIDVCSLDHSNRWWVSTPGAIRAGNSKGLVVENAAQNLTAGGAHTVNVNPQVRLGWWTTGGVLALVDDSVALLAAKAEAWGANAMSFSNVTGVVQIAYAGSLGLAGAVRSFAILARYANGGGALLGVYDTGTATFTSLAPILDGYALTLAQDRTALSNDERYAISIPDQCELRFTGQTLSTNRRIGAPISTYSATIERFADFATTEHVPADASDSILARVKPAGWSGAECAADVTILTQVTTPADILHAESAAAGWATGDGTTQIQTVAPNIPADSVSVDVWSAWQGALQYIQQGATGQVSGLYGGAKGGAGPLQATSANGEYRLEWIEIRQI